MKSREVPVLFLIVCVFAVGSALFRVSADEQGGEVMPVQVTIIPTQDGVILTGGDPWVWDDYAAPLEYYVIMQLPPGAQTVPTGGELLFIAPDGVLQVSPVTLPITPDSPVQRGPFGYVPSSSECPGVQANAIYRPPNGTVHNAVSALNRLPVQPCDCDGDTNADGIVNSDDLVTVILNWGTVCPQWPPQSQEWHGAGGMPTAMCPCGKGHSRVLRSSKGYIENWVWGWPCLDDYPELGHGEPVAGGS